MTSSLLFTPALPSQGGRSVRWLSMKNARVILLAGGSVLLSLFYNPTVALSEEVAEQKEGGAQASELVQQAPVSQTFIAEQGQVYQDSETGFTITPPSGWEVTSNTSSLSLIMREPKEEKVDYENAKYQKNITVAVIHEASPIDELRAQQLKEEITEKFGKDGLVSEFQILEHKFFNYKSQNDGLLVYTSSLLNNFPVMQMHILVSGEDKQYLLSYTDLAKSFSDSKDPGFEQAWQSMVSINVNGVAPVRKNIWMQYGPYAGGAVTLLLLLYILRRKFAHKDYRAEAEELESSLNSGNALGESNSASMDGMASSVFATLHAGWRLGKEGSNEEDHLGVGGSSQAASDSAASCFSNFSSPATSF